jgi:predicted ester cyclase
VSKENLRRLERLLLEGFGRGDMSVLDEVVAEDLIEHQRGMPQGREGLRSVIRTLRRAFPDLRYEVVQMAADGEKVWGTSVRGAPTMAPSWAILLHERPCRST